MADKKPIGFIDENTPVGSLIIMEGIEKAPGDEYTLTVHFEGDGDIPPGFELAGVGEGDKDLEARHTYDGWNDDYASFVAEIKYPPKAEELEPSNPPVAEVPGPVGITVSMPAPNAPTARLSLLEEAVASARDNRKESAAEFLALKEQTAAAKKKMDDDQDALNKAVDAWLEDREIGATGWPKNAPLAKEASEARPATGEGSNDLSILGVEDEDDDAAPAPAADDAWRTVLLRNLTPDIKPGILKVLLEHKPPIVTMGDMADWQKEKGDFWAKDIRGIGKAACDSIAAATDAYWVANAVAVAAANKGQCDGSCGWHDLSDEIQDMLDDGRYEFANDTLCGIMDWVNENEHCTEAQREAVANIRTSAENR
jgi:hypothetical protein